VASIAVLVVAMLGIAELGLHKYYRNRNQRYKRCAWTITIVGIIFWFVYWIVLGEVMNPFWVLMAAGISLFAELLVTIGIR
jgi:hypothetical protein